MKIFVLAGLFLGMSCLALPAMAGYSDANGYIWTPDGIYHNSGRTAALSAQAHLGKLSAGNGCIVSGQLEQPAEDKPVYILTATSMDGVACPDSEKFIVTIVDGPGVHAVGNAGVIKIAHEKHNGGVDFSGAYALDYKLSHDYNHKMAKLPVQEQEADTTDVTSTDTQGGAAGLSALCARLGAEMAEEASPFNANFFYGLYRASASNRQVTLKKLRDKRDEVERKIKSPTDGSQLQKDFLVSMFSLMVESLQWVDGQADQIEGDGLTVYALQDQYQQACAAGELPSVRKYLVSVKQLMARQIAEHGYIIGNKGKTVLDKKTGLMWMRCPLGTTYGNGRCRGTADDYRWSDAMQVVKKIDEYAGFDDWRLPSVKELHTLVYCSTHKQDHFDTSKLSKSHWIAGGNCVGPYDQPTILLAAFPNTKEGFYWSATSALTGDLDRAWVVNFGSGLVHAERKLKGVNGLVRLVRGGK